jgi:GxxExxY protein
MGACFEVYKAMGRGFLEPVYQECLEIELNNRGIPFVAQHELQIVYKGRTLEQTYKPDFVCYDKIIIAAKAEKRHDPRQHIQVGHRDPRWKRQARPRSRQ